MIIRKPLVATGAMVAVLGLSACGSDETSDEAATTTAAAAPSAEVLQAQLATFFDPDVDVAERAAVAEEGDQRTEVLEQLGGVLTGYPLTAEVGEVTVDGDTATAVTDITGPHGGAPIPVEFARVNGEWLISDDSTCEFLGMARLSCS
ncbi:nuclear transport factor 2 family protein [Rhodococcus xishaensis]|uniref:Nuclear transport factor 2 family protein n=1 Tax=Rhodococcus xishaensis TaxID=2487364 RepID=A0A438AZR8_9NOCA|nr:nuclear transport factor 2 family protein [Rhodococcus xishaensis]RVW04173.1 nuclear transport factor 2 family protein [Rhodococcus xishaensis]